MGTESPGGGGVTAGPREETRLPRGLAGCSQQAALAPFGFAQTVQLFRPDAASGLSPVKIPVVHFASSLEVTRC